MHNIDSFNSRKIGNLIERIQYLFITVTLILTGLVSFCAFKWFQAAHQDVIYFVTPDGTYCSKKRSYSIHCESFEIENFTIQFLKNAFEHNEHTYKSNMDGAMRVMDQTSRLHLQNKYGGEDLFDLYKNYNALSILSIDNLQVNMDDYPYEVIAFYTIEMKFLNLEAKKMMGASNNTFHGGIYFKANKTHRSRENPYGLLITHFSFVDYKNKDNYVQKNTQ